MVAWIEKEVEASIMEIGPRFIDPLQRFCFKFDFFQFWTVKKLSFCCRYGAVCLL